MTAAFIPILRSLRDIDGVLGSFLWLADGRVVASDVPRSCSLEALVAVAARVQRLCDAYASVGDHFESTTLAFVHYKLHACAFDGAFIGVVLASHVNMSALKMALKLARTDAARLLAAPHRPPPPPPPGPTAQARVYRGQRNSD